MPAKTRAPRRKPLTAIELAAVGALMTQARARLRELAPDDEWTELPLGRIYEQLESHFAEIEADAEENFMDVETIEKAAAALVMLHYRAERERAQRNGGKG